MNSNTLETTSEEMIGEKNIRKQKQLSSSKSRKKGCSFWSLGSVCSLLWVLDCIVCFLRRRSGSP